MKTFLSLLYFAGAAIYCYSAVSITFSEFGNYTSLGDVNGTATDGMNWAIIVDSAGDGLDSVESNVGYDPFDITVSNQFLSLGGSASDDYYLFGDSLGLTTSFISQVGTALSLTNLTDSTEDTNLAGTPSFGIIWFPGNSADAGDSFGTLFTSSVTFPSGPAASINEFGYAGGSTGIANQTIAVPEPAHFAVIFGLLGLGVVMWRQRR